MREPDRLIEFFTEVLISQRGSTKNTVSSYTRDLYSFKEYLNQIPLDSVTSDNLIAYICMLHDRKRSNKTICRHISTLRQFYNFLTEEQIVVSNPTLYIDNPKVTKILPKSLDIQSVLKLFEASDSMTYLESLRAKILLHLLYGSGLRVSELTNLKVNSISFEGQYVRVFGKGNRERIVPIPHQLLALLKEWITDRGCTSIDWLFPSANSKKSLTRQRVFQIIKNLAALAGIESRLVSPHVMRHAFATHLVNNGADLLSVKKMLGHQSITTTEIYTHVSNEKIKTELLSKHPLAKIKDH